MAELKDKELNEVNGGSISDWAEKKKEQIEKWEKNSNNPVTPISDPLLPGEEGFSRLSLITLTTRHLRTAKNKPTNGH